jgi:adenylate cyclase
MEVHNVERRLAAILATDVVGYSRLMEVDEAGTLARLKTVRLEVIDPAIAKCRGRIIKTTGDGMLVEFQSVREALGCAIDFQERMARRNRDMPAARALLFRIGLNLGDVIVEDGDIFGDGVNVAARLETMAEPGGISISAAVRDQVGDRLKVGYADLGDQQVKNISRPIRAYKVLIDAPAAEAGHAASDSSHGPPAGAKKPSIAVLPFDNMSGDSEQEFFVDGLTEDIITELSRGQLVAGDGRRPVTAETIDPGRGPRQLIPGESRRMDLNNDIAVIRAREAGKRCPQRLGPLHQLHPGRSRSPIRYHDCLHGNYLL